MSHPYLTFWVAACFTLAFILWALQSSGTI